MVVAIDQHAADERIKLDKSSTEYETSIEYGPADMFDLRQPIEVDVEHCTFSELSAHAEDMLRFGIKARFMDYSKVVVSGFPALAVDDKNCDLTLARELLEHMADHLQRNVREKIPKPIFSLLQSKACRWVFAPLCTLFDIFVGLPSCLATPCLKRNAQN